MRKDLKYLHDLIVKKVENMISCVLQIIQRLKVIFSPDVSETWPI